MSANNIRKGCERTTKDSLSSKKRRTLRMQELDERKQKILHAIIQNYLETGEPVGSRTISK